MGRCIAHSKVGKVTSAIWNSRIRRDLGITKGEALEITTKAAIVLKRKKIVSVAHTYGARGHFAVDIDDIKDAPG